jgi:hypothetical protein
MIAKSDDEIMACLENRVTFTIHESITKLNLFGKYLPLFLPTPKQPKRLDPQRQLHLPMKNKSITLFNLGCKFFFCA